MSFTPLSASATFVFSAAVIIVAAIFLAFSADKISNHSRLGRLWVGSILLAGTTSLPELVTTITAVRIDAPSLSWGNILGANMLNMATLSVMLAIFLKINTSTMCQREQLVVGSLVIGLTIIAVGSSYFDVGTKVSIISPAGASIIALFLLYTTLTQRTKQPDDLTLIKIPRSDSYSSWQIWLWFTCSAFGILIAAPFLASSAQSISDYSGLSESFIGVLGLAIVTTLPELTTTATALRIKAYDLGISNMLGTNAINIVILAIADGFYSNGSLFSRIDNSHVVTGLISVLLTVLMMLSLHQTQHGKKSMIHINAVISPTLYGATVALIYLTDATF
jgi:cation:H+ antiporter